MLGSTAHLLFNNAGHLPNESDKGAYMKVKAISLFAGVGGLDMGVDQVGFKTVCSIELDQHCVTTLHNNSVGKTVWQVDIRALDPLGTARALGIVPGELALLHGGPPCQPFSQIGKKGGISDPRGQLVFEMVRFTEVLRPAAVLMEQVPQFLQTKVKEGTKIIDVLKEAFWQIGYEMTASVLDAMDFQVPQKRKRAIIVCLPEGVSFEFPLAKSVASGIKSLLCL